MKKTYLFSIFCMLIASNSWSSEYGDVGSTGLQRNPPGNNPYWNTSGSTLSSTTMQVEYTLDPIDRDTIGVGVAPAVFNETSSSNWSGYVAAPSLTSPVSDSVSQVSGYWIVPSLSPTSDTTYCALWVGIDGYTSGTVEQIGTSHNWVNGQQQNYAWFEMYPQGPYQITGFPVNPGDVMSGEVNYIGNGVFEMTLINKTRGVHVVIPYSYTTSLTAERSCAEWVVEAPSTSQGILPLADFGDATFTQCYTNIQGKSGTISSGTWVSDEILMESSGHVKAQPSSLINSGRRFNVAWGHE